MKKLLTKILIGALAVVAVLGGLTACGSGSSWTGTSMTNWGKDVENASLGGFIAEKENYYYYINGIAENTLDNTFGAPVKGALMAVDKNDFSKTEIVVPKLFSAQDYGAGLYIYGDYVYYGTPNTDKNSEGEAANTELTFMKTKLDGTETTKLFTINNLIDEYRVVKNGDSVVVVYYNSEKSAIETFNCSTNETSTVAKVDATAQGVNAESLKNCIFSDTLDGYLLYYNVTVYAEDYNENKEDERATESYTKVYGYSVKDGSVLLLDGSKDGESVALNGAIHELKMVKNGKLYFTEEILSVSKTYCLDQTKIEITNASALAESSLIVSNDEVYTVSDGAIVKTVLTGKYQNSTRNVAVNTGAATLKGINGNYIYFTDAESGISRIDITKADANVEKVAYGAVNATWYPIEFINGKMFYCDNSAEGASYVKYVDINGEVKAEDTDEDGENDKFFLEGQTLLGKVSDTDKVAIATAKVEAISTKLDNGVLPFEKNDEGKLYVKAVDEAVSASEGLELSEETSEKLEKYKKAIEIANLYNRLDGIRDEMNASSFETAYNEVKAQIEEFRASADYTELTALINSTTNNLFANYDLAVQKFGK